MSGDAKSRLRAKLKRGSLFEGKFRIKGHLGTGSFAYVMLAEHEVMERTVALKIVKPELVDQNPDMLERFMNEVKIVSKLKHPNTVTVFDFGRTSDGISYLVMEHVEGVPLNEVIDSEGALDDTRAVDITKQILKSLAEAHSLGIVHRDLKPSNIMLTQTHEGVEVAKVLDFGVAKLGESAAGGKKRRSTRFVGTPIYMSPEQVLGEEVVPASDLYSLGLMLYEMLVGAPPFANMAVAHIAQAHIDKGPLELDGLDLLAPRMRKLIERATSRRVEDRFGDVKSFARALPITTKDHSAEFAQLTGGGADISDEIADVFAGRNYIEAPESEASDVPNLAPISRKGSKQKSLPQVEARTPTKRPAHISVDLTPVLREQRMKRRVDPSSGVQTIPQSTQRGPGVYVDWVTRGWLAGGLFALIIAFLIASTVFIDTDGADRWLVGLVPVGIAVLWTKFASVKVLHGSWVERTLVPLAQHMVWTAGLHVVFVALAMPGTGATRMRDLGDSAIDMARESSAAILWKSVGFLAHALGKVFAIASQILPW